MAALLPALVHGQSFNGSIAGRVLDPAGAVVSGAELTLKNVAAGVEVKRTSNDAGEYAFRNLLPGTYELRGTSTGFSPYLRRNIEVTMNADVRLDVVLPVSGRTEEVEVVGQSILNYDTGAKVEGIAPGTLAQLPILTAGRPRSSAGFAILMPGVSTGGGANPFGARLNGGMQTGDEAVLDGASMQQGHMSQGGMISIFQDFPFSPDMVSEVKVLTSSYEPQYGGSTSGQIMATTKSGGDAFHGSLFEYHRNDALNATQYGASKKAVNKQNNFGVALGGPAKVPGLWSSSVKTYFYLVGEGYRQEGGANTPTRSIPSLRNRSGDFSDWRDANGNLIPIYDPATTRVRERRRSSATNSPATSFPRTGSTPIARQWLQYLPNPTNSGPLNNYLVPVPVPDTLVADSNTYFGRFDTYIGQKDHLSMTLWHQRSPAKFNSELPHEIAFETYSDPQNSWVNRANWDHTFGPNVHNHMTFGYLNRNEGYGSVNQDAVDALPKIAGVAGNNVPPTVQFSDGFSDWGNNAGINVGNVTTRPTFVWNDLVTFIKGSHTIKTGFEYRNIGGNLPFQRQPGGDLRVRTGRHRRPGTEQRQPDRELPARRRGQRQLRLPHLAEHVREAVRLHRPCRRHLEGEPQADRELRPALGRVHALEGEIQQLLLLRSGGREPDRGRAAGTPRLRRRRGRRGQLRSELPGEDLLESLPAAARDDVRRSTRRRWSGADGGSSTTRRSTPAGAAGSPRRDSTATSPSAARWAASNRPSSCRTASPRTSRRRPSSGRTSRTGRTSCTGRSTPTSAHARSSGTSPWTARSAGTSW